MRARVETLSADARADQLSVRLSPTHDTRYETVQSIRCSTSRGTGQSSHSDEQTSTLLVMEVNGRSNAYERLSVGAGSILQPS